MLLLLTENLRWALSLVLILLNHVAYLHLHLFVALGIWSTNWFINDKHCRVWIEPLKIYNFLDFGLVWTNLIRLNETLFLANWKRHFLKRIIILLLLKLIGKGICWSVLCHFVKLLISWNIIFQTSTFHSEHLIRAILDSLAHLFWTFDFKHVESDVSISSIKVVNFITIMFRWYKNHTVLIFEIFKCFDGVSELVVLYDNVIFFGWVILQVIDFTVLLQHFSMLFGFTDTYNF